MLKRGENQTVGTVMIDARTDNEETAERAFGILLLFLSCGNHASYAAEHKNRWMSISSGFAWIGKGGFWLVVCSAGERLANDISDEDRKFLEKLDFLMEYRFTDMGEDGMSRKHMANTHEAGTPLESMASETLSPSQWETY